MVGRRTRLGRAGAVLLIAVVLAAVGVGIGRESAATSVPPSATPTPMLSAGPDTRANPAEGGPALQLVGLGDSVTSGSGCGCSDYITGLGRLLAAEDHRAVDVQNEGDPGATTSDLLDDLEHDRRTRTAVRAADVVVVTIGANDLAPALETWRSSDCPAGCYTPQVAAMGRRLGQVVAAVDAVHPGHHPTVVVTNYWNVFRDGDVGRRAEDDGYLDWSDAVTRVADAAICRSASLGGARCVDLYTPFKGDGSGDPTSYLADDGDHPNAAGTALISRTVLAALDR